MKFLYYNNPPPRAGAGINNLGNPPSMNLSFFECTHSTIFTMYLLLVAQLVPGAAGPTSPSGSNGGLDRQTVSNVSHTSNSKINHCVVARH